MLKFDPAWRYSSPGTIDPGVQTDAYSLIKRVSSSFENKQTIIEHFKDFFAQAGNRTAYTSSSLSWAETDLLDYMNSAAENAPLFIEALYDGLKTLSEKWPAAALPDAAMINQILLRYPSGYEIREHQLVRLTAETTITVDPKVPSLTEQAQEKIQTSLKQAETLLALNRGRQAVQEVLWLLETVSTAFQGAQINGETVQGRYFNKIAEDLRRNHSGQTLGQSIVWMKTLHGFLSSPTGGGVRHGESINSVRTLAPHEARLFCNLIRSYIAFLIEEHARLMGMTNSD